MKLTRHSRHLREPCLHKKLLSILVLSILVASTLVGCGQGQSTPSPAIFSTSGGNVSVMKGGTGGWIEAQVGMSLEPGDMIKSGDNSSAEITFLDGSTIELQAGTEIEVVLLDIPTDTGSTTIRLKQTIGSIIFRVTKIVDPASRYEVETPTGTVAIRGSAMQITVSEDGTTWACNLEGHIWAFAQGVELQIPEGRCCVIRLGQPPKLICDLTVFSTTGGSVTIPGEGTFPYDEGTVVDLVAEAEEGYQFGSWTGDVGSIPSVNAATTTITMRGDYSVTANFEEDEVVTFADPNLEAAIRQAISNPEGPIYGSDLDGLVELYAGQRSISTLGGLEHCTSLTGLDLANNQISDISPLANLTSLTELGLTYTQISDISPLANLTSLTRLGLEYTQISDISPLASLTRLTELGLAYTQISNISPLANLTSLTRLGLEYTQISDISPLANLTNLTGLALNYTQISDISPLANLTSLRGLDLRGNQISDISPLANLTSLTELGLGYNQISDISPLANLTSLTNLGLRYNQISDISPIANLTSLTQLWLDGNEVSDISPIANLTSLTWLGLYSNQVSDISSLANLTSLTLLYLHDNQISDIRPLVQNEGLGTGDLVNLQANPLSSDSVNIYIPQLQARGVTVSH